MRLVPLLSALVLCAGASAQQPVVVPSAAATTKPTNSPFYDGNVFYSTTSTTIAPASRTQAIVDVADIPMPATVWNSLAVRRPQSLGNANPQFTATATIVMSVSPNPWTASTTNFANNHGPNTTTVLSGTINLQAATNPPAWPAPWQAPFPFTTPFVYAGAPGGSLVIDLHQDQGTSPAGTRWYVEYTSPDTGGRVTNLSASGCQFTGGTWNNGLSFTTAGLQGNGGTWYVQYNNLEPNVPGLGVLGSQGVGGNWGGLPLPIDLGPAGAPGCRWAVDWLFAQSITADANGRGRWPNQTIPNDPALRGASFYDHSLWVDPTANALGLVVGWSSRWDIGTGIGAPGAFVRATGNSAGNPTGVRVAAALPTYQLQ